MMNAIRSVFSSGWNTIRSIFHGGANMIRNIMQGVNLFSIGQNIISGLINGINSMIGSLMNAIGNVASSVTRGLSGLLKIHSPSKVMRDEIGKWIPAGIAVGMERNIGVIDSANRKLAQAMTFDVPDQSFDKWNALNAQARTSLSGTYEQRLSINQQPAEIHLTLGGTEFTTFVDDISKQQGKDAQFQRSYKF